MIDNKNEYENLQKDMYNYLSPIMCELVNKYNIDPENLINIAPSIIFASDDKFDEVLKNIVPDIEYTNEEECKCVGKFIHKNGKYYLVIKSYFINDLIKSNYKDIIAKYTICHELGHWINHLIKPELCPKEKPKHPDSGIKISEYLYTISIDEYRANNHIVFLFSSDECKEIIKNDYLYKDIENIYININDSNDLFTRIWNSPNSIFKNLIGHIPLYIKCGGYIDDDVLDIININGIISGLEKENPDYEGLYKHLIYVFNLIVKDYNSDKPEIIQNYL